MITRITTQGGGIIRITTGGTTLSAQQISDLAFATPATISYTTAIPLTRALTIITGKTLTTNDTLTIASNPVNGANAETWLDGDGEHEPILTNIDYIIGAYDKDVNSRNFITIKYRGGKSYIYFETIYP